MGISAMGIGTGLDINGLVTGLVKAESAPVTSALDRRQSEAQAKLSALGTLKGALSTFQTAAAKLKSPTAFTSLLTAKSANETMFKATAGSGAVAGKYSIAVQSLAAAETKVSATAGYTSASTFGSGSLTFNVGVAAPVTVNITAGSNDTLSGIAAAVNSANAGVTASVINVASGSKLMFTSNSTGAANAFSVTGSLTPFTDTGSGGAMSNLVADGGTAAADAAFTINGMAATSASNTVTSALPGVTLTLNSTGAAANLDVAVDSAAITKTVNDFASAYNSLQQTIKSLGGYDSATKKAGPLMGDTILRSIDSQVRRDVGNVVTTATGNYNSASMLGLGIDRYGTMTVSQTKLDAAVANNMSNLSNVFSGTDGVATRLDTDLTSLLANTGTLSGQTTSLNSTLKKITIDRENLQVRMNTFEKNLFKQFNAMDTMVASIKSTGSYLSQALGG